MLKTKIKSLTQATLWTEEGLQEKSSLSIQGTRFASISTSSRKNRPQSLSLDGAFVLPGLIDLHVNGMGKCDLRDHPESSLERFSIKMAEKGVTTFLPTLISTPIQALKQQVAHIASLSKKRWGGAIPFGLHLEGPFIHPKRKGAHIEKSIETLTEAKLKQLLMAGKGFIKMITLAPEKDPNGKFLKLLKQYRVKPAMGHSDATYEQGLKAIQQGYHFATHLFNAMPPWHHRKPGLAGAALEQSSVYCECLPDGAHLSYPALDMVYKVKGKDKLILASDEWVGYSRNVNKDWVRQGRAYVSLKSGGLVGSATSLFEGLKTWAKNSKREWTELIPLVTINPSKFLGLSHRLGSIQKGKQADFIVVTKDLKLKMTVVAGDVVFCHPSWKHKLSQF